MPLSPPIRITFYSAAVGLMACSASYGPYSKPITASQDMLHFEGRVLQTAEDEGREMGFPGVELSFESLGNYSSEMTLEFFSETSDLAIDVRLDEFPVETIPLNQGVNKIDLGFLWSRYFHSHEKPGCLVTVTRRNEAWQGKLTFLDLKSNFDFYVNDDVLRNYPVPKTKLLFIGDSITAGAGTQSRVNAAGEREAVSNARVAYPRVLGERLNTQVHQIAYGGRGLARDWQGITNTNNAPQFYDRVLPDNPDHIWDHADYPADIVSVMLGTNDFNTGIPERDNWTQSYVTFVERIRSDYPMAQVFLISSPMTGGEKGDVLKSYVSEVAASFDTPQVKYLEVSQYYGEPWDSHPTAAEHKKIADELEPHFKAALDNSK